MMYHSTQNPSSNSSMKLHENGGKFKHSPTVPQATANSTPANETPTDSNENSSDIVVLNDAGEEKPAKAVTPSETPPASQTPSGDQQAGVPTTEPVAEPAAPSPKAATATPMDNSESSDKAGPPGQEAVLASV